MPTIQWDETSPSDSENAGLGDDRIRSLKTSVRVGLDGEHIWPSAGGDAGVHRLGSARAYHGTESRVSSSGTDGRLMVASDTSRFFHVGSVSTSYVGGPTVISLGTYPGTTPQRHIWAEEVGVQEVSGAAVEITFPNSGFSGVPYTFLSVYTGGGGNGILSAQITTIDNGAFTVIIRSHNNTASAATLFWRSIGTRIL